MRVSFPCQHQHNVFFFFLFMLPSIICLPRSWWLLPATIILHSVPHLVLSFMNPILYPFRMLTCHPLASHFYPVVSHQVTLIPFQPYTIVPRTVPSLFTYLPSCLLQAYTVSFNHTLVPNTGPSEPLLVRLQSTLRPSCALSTQSSFMQTGIFGELLYLLC